MYSNRRMRKWQEGSYNSELSVRYNKCFTFHLKCNIIVADSTLVSSTIDWYRRQSCHVRWMFQIYFHICPWDISHAVSANTTMDILLSSRNRDATVTSKSIIISISSAFQCEHFKLSRCGNLTVRTMHLGSCYKDTSCLGLATGHTGPDQIAKTSHYFL